MCGLQPFWADQWSNLHPSYQSYRTYLIMDSMRGDPAIEPFQSESDRSWVWNRPNINPSYQSYRTYLIMDSAGGDPAIEPFFSRSQIDLIVWAWEAAAMIPGFATRLDGSSTAMSKPPRLSSSTTTPKAFSSTKTWEPTTEQQWEPTTEQVDLWRLWERNRWKWEKQTQIPVLNMSWLSVSDEGRVGCVICKMTKQDNEYGNYDVITGNFSNMKRHSECKQHQQALAQLGLIEVTADEDAPSMSAFEQVARGRMKGPSALRHGEAGVGGRKKITHMVQCLGDAVFELDRRFIATAETITLHTDVRQLKLLVRFRAANQKLQIRRGILGIKDLERDSAST